MTNTLLIVVLSLYLLTGILGASWTLFIYPRLPKDQQAAARQKIIEGVANQVVPAIQQSAADLDNATKRAEAIKQVQDILEKDFGIKGVSYTLLSASIEGAVFLMKQGIVAFKTWQQQQEEPVPSNIQPPNPA